MSANVSVMERYKQDPRIPCRYGEKCYQKNSAHTTKYKHPPQAKRKQNRNATAAKRPKLETTEIDDRLLDPELDKQLSLSVENSGENKKETVSSSEDENEAVFKQSGVRRNTSISPGPSSSVENNGDSKKETVSSSDSDDNETVSKQSDIRINESNSSLNYEINDTPSLCETEGKFISEGDSNKQVTPDESFDPRLFIKSRFLVDVPADFYDFWDFCKQLKPTAPNGALKDVGLELVGPYDVLAGKFRHVKRSAEDYLRHWRYYYDPPEVLTVIKSNNQTGYHIGYFFDSPDQTPSFLVSNDGKDGVFTKMGDNIFAAVSICLDQLRQVGDPFKKMHVGKLLSKIKMHSEKLNLNLSSHSKKMKEREFKVVVKTFNKIGLVVPYNKKTQLGYRELAIADKELMILLNKLEKAAPEQRSKYLSDLQPVLTYANIALDECDFGTGVKLGWELLYHGIDSLNSTISQFLGNSYRLLNKEAFAKIAETHMGNRKKGCNLSII